MFFKDWRWPHASKPDFDNPFEQVEYNKPSFSAFGAKSFKGQCGSHLPSIEDLLSRSRLRGVPRLALVVIALGCLIAFLFAVSRCIPATARTGFEVLDQSSNEGSNTVASLSIDTSKTDATGSQSLFVHVVGAVCSPGVYELSSGSRVIDALEIAGGPKKNASLASVNLAREVADGEQILFPTLKEVESGEVAASAFISSGVDSLGNLNSSGTAQKKVNINTAAADLLDTLPGVGPSTAEKIIADREANGAFANPEDLQRVSGIGEKKYAQLADLICVS